MVQGNQAFVSEWLAVSVSLAIVESHKHKAGGKGFCPLLTNEEHIMNESNSRPIIHQEGGQCKKKKDCILNIEERQTTFNVPLSVSHCLI